MTPFWNQCCYEYPNQSTVSANNAHVEDNADSLIGDFSQDLLGLGLGNEALDLELEKMEQERERLEHLKEMKRVKLLRLAELQRKVEKARLEFGATTRGSAMTATPRTTPLASQHELDSIQEDRKAELRYKQGDQGTNPSNLR
ncbi:hypothetical protein DFS34DRAFT_654498 [Phlyctochytrium arcticum]|nr:hypothetical protein DFS34DRAFT_654498 [Phlyctochytrium arcticum]